MAFVKPITKARERIAVLDEEIDNLSKSKPGQLLTPKRTVFSGIAAVVIVSFSLAYWHPWPAGTAQYATVPRQDGSPALAGTGTSATADGGRGPATLQCWNDANTIMDEEGKVRVKSMDPAQIASALRTAAMKFRQLPVIKIDPDFAHLCAELSGWYADLAATYENAAIFEANAKQVHDSFSSPDAAAEAFIRGLKGDPLGKYDEAVAADDSLRQQFQALRSELDTKLQRCRRFNIEAAELRATLTNRYSIEFPDFH